MIFSPDDISITLRFEALYLYTIHIHLISSNKDTPLLYECSTSIHLPFFSYQSIQEMKTVEKSAWYSFNLTQHLNIDSILFKDEKKKEKNIFFYGISSFKIGKFISNCSSIHLALCVVYVYVCIRFDRNLCRCLCCSSHRTFEKVKRKTRSTSWWW